MSAGNTTHCVHLKQIIATATSLAKATARHYHRQLPPPYLCLGPCVCAVESRACAYVYTQANAYACVSHVPVCMCVCVCVCTRTYVHREGREGGGGGVQCGWLAGVKIGWIVSVRRMGPLFM